jgi:hypothetical protein
MQETKKVNKNQPATGEKDHLRRGAYVQKTFYWCYVSNKIRQIYNKKLSSLAKLCGHESKRL